VSTETESVEGFRQRAREWITANLTPLAEVPGHPGGTGVAGRDEAAWLRARELQARLHAGGFAGICFPREYGGLGLSAAHQRAFNEECAGFEMPALLNIPTLTICCATILDMGSEEQKRQHLAAAIRGEEVFVQFLSEPGSGSDLASVTTRATRDGDVFVLSGAKIWSSAAYAADYALCLARTDWEVPKHEGLTMFLVKVRQPGIEVTRIKQVDGSSEFCQEFIDGVEVPVSAVVGEVNGGWAVASRQLFHERNAMGAASPFLSGPSPAQDRISSLADLMSLARLSGVAGDTTARELIAEYHALGKLQEHLASRITVAVRSGQLPPAASSVIRLFSGEATTRRAEIALELAGPAAAMSTGPAAPGVGVHFIARQGGSLGGGSTEMARNIISERLLGMPREYAADKGIPFSQVKRGR
jgi:alkylation response protein AidB-like acyl-CoA dehydrogenase